MNMFRRDKGAAAPVVPPRPSQEAFLCHQDLDNPVEHSLNTQDEGTGGNSDVTTPFYGQQSSFLRVTGAGNRLHANLGGLRGVMHKVNPFKSTSQASSTVSNAPSSESLEQGTDATQTPGVLRGVINKVNPFKSTSQKRKGVMQKVNPFKSSTQGPQSDPPDDSADPPETGNELQDKQVDIVVSYKSHANYIVISSHNPGKIAGMMQKVNPFKSSQPKDNQPLHGDLSSSSGSLDNNSVSEKQNPGMFKGMMQKVNPFKSHTQTPGEECQTDSSSSLMTQVRFTENPALHSDHSSSSDSINDGTIERHSIWYADADPVLEVKGPPAEAPRNRTMTFRIKKILPTALFGSRTKDSSADTQAPPELADVPALSEGTTFDPLDDEEGLLAWWNMVEGWSEWSEGNQDEEPQDVVEQAADRVFMAARLFVRFFNQRGATLQQRILELLSLADSADVFHKKTVQASVGGGVASVAGSITTITGLILAPFTAGASLIVVAVGIGVATAGGVASASANITDTVHSKTDRKKEGMEALEEWNFEAYAESISKKHLNQNVKHVMKEGGRAGKALVVNTESLINTVQVLTAAGSAAKAVQVMSITTGVMSGLFLALDVFFLAKDTMELKKGAKTEFAAKIREVCKDLQDGLLELNRIKEQLQKTIDGIEVEVEEEEDEELLKSELKKLVEFDE
ncbi:hypothetical protein F7725_004739 [Dissostichus mawsoni]|uniref:Uncharacterized protein n=1 Tax=Dissostichus mawsoni TaxID=36200 RepID=A0A7J5XJM5_DISMA|nr:hypothetical protein F7725_004739 [Dissostichus mawsoni]